MNSMISAKPVSPAYEAEFIEVNGVALEVRFIGPSPDEAPTLVFLHEGLGSVRLWKDLPERVAAATGMGVLVYSREGYGVSGRKPAPWSRAYLHEEALFWLPRVIAAAGVRRALLVGHSDGGTISAIAAASNVIPQMEGVALLAPHVMVEPITLAGVEGAVAAYEKGRLREALSRHHNHADDVFWGWATAWREYGRNGFDVRPMLSGITKPTLVVQGDLDDFGSADQYESVRMAVSGPVEVQILEKCGHQLHRDCPAEVTAALARFARRVFG